MPQYKWLVVGANGQVGRSFVRILRGSEESVAVLVRRRHTMPEDMADVYEGDVNEIEDLPRADNIINAAGLTRLNRSLDEYVQENVLVPLRLLRHAERTGAVLHHISSIAVVSPNDYAYRVSKKLAEQLLVGMMIAPDQLRIYRIGDIVPDPDLLGFGVRADHWLPMLCQYNGFRDFPDSYRVLLACGSDIARAVITLSEVPGIHYVCGLRYGMRYLGTFAKAPYSGVGSKVVQRLMRPEPSLASLVDESGTNVLLDMAGFAWTPLGDKYWTEFHRQATRRKGS